jgi:hypothetical protein
MIQRIPGIVVRTVIETRSVSFFATTDQDTIMGQNAWGYFYEPEELAMIGRHFTPGGTFLDVGGTTLVRDPAGAIPLATGDELLDDRPVEFIKVDVEGMELQVLSGLTRTIERYRPNLFVEVDNAHQAEFLKWAEVMGYGVAETYNRYGSQENFLLVPTR